MSAMNAKNADAKNANASANATVMRLVDGGMRRLSLLEGGGTMAAGGGRHEGPRGEWVKGGGEG
jgi:hypothetical protein